jgi:hypothetical protein
MSKPFILDIDNTTKSIPIPIASPTSISCSLSTENFDKTYYFKLKLKLNNKETFFYSSENKNYSNIITSVNKIKYDDINYYKITVNSLNSTFELDGNINNQSSSYVNQANNLFIEFSQDYFGYVNCTCYYINNDLNNLCISPPN